MGTQSVSSGIWMRLQIGYIQDWTAFFFPCNRGFILPNHTCCLVYQQRSHLLGYTWVELVGGPWLYELLASGFFMCMVSWICNDDNRVPDEIRLIYAMRE